MSHMKAVGAQALKQSARRTSPSVLVLLSPIVPFLSPNPTRLERLQRPGPLANTG